MTGCGCGSLHNRIPNQFLPHIYIESCRGIHSYIVSQVYLLKTESIHFHVHHLKSLPWSWTSCYFFSIAVTLCPGQWLQASNATSLPHCIYKLWCPVYSIALDAYWPLQEGTATLQQVLFLISSYPPHHKSLVWELVYPLIIWPCGK